MDVDLLFDRDERKGSIGVDEGSSGCWEEFVGIYLIFDNICIFRLFLSKTGEAFSEECPISKRDRKILEKLILKRARLGTKILTDGCCFCMLTQIVGFSS